MKVECPRCGTHVEKPLQGDPVCPNCGYGAPEGQSTGAAGGSPPPAGAPGQPGGPSQPQAFTPSPGPQNQPPRQGLAITALVLGIVGCCVIPVLPSIGAIITGAIAMKQAKNEPQTYGGSGMALTGLILGIVGLVLGLIFVIFYGVIIAAVLECEENPDSEFCQDLEEGQNDPMTLDRGPAPTMSMLPLAVAPVIRPWRLAG